jgi:hypothetical protein
MQYACRKTLADSRPRVRGRFAKNDELCEAAQSSSQIHEHYEQTVSFQAYYSVLLEITVPITHLFQHPFIHIFLGMVTFANFMKYITHLFQLSINPLCHIFTG